MLFAHAQMEFQFLVCRPAKIQKISKIAQIAILTDFPGDEEIEEAEDEEVPNGTLWHGNVAPSFENTLQVLHEICHQPGPALPIGEMMNDKLLQHQ